MLKQLYQKCIPLSFGIKDVKGYVSTRCIIYRDEVFLRRLSTTEHKLSSSEKDLSKIPPDLPSQSQIVIAGAGTVANSVAYHLVLNGWNDVLVLEQNT